MSILREGVAADVAAFKKNPAAAAKLLAYGEAKNGAGLDPAELAAYTLAANVLLNLDETVTRE